MDWFTRSLIIAMAVLLVLPGEASSLARLAISAPICFFGVSPDALCNALIW